jgi:hypothetical protein
MSDIDAADRASHAVEFAIFTTPPRSFPRSTSSFAITLYQVTQYRSSVHQDALSTLWMTAFQHLRDTGAHRVFQLRCRLDAVASSSPNPSITTSPEATSSLVRLLILIPGIVSDEPTNQDRRVLVFQTSRGPICQERATARSRLYTEVPSGSSEPTARGTHSQFDSTKATRSSLVVNLEY